MTARPALSLSLQFADGRHRGALVRADVARWIRAAIAAPAEITVRVVDDTEGRRLNREFRGIDHATNVLTFPYATGPVLSADLVLCAPVVEREASEQVVASAPKDARTPAREGVRWASTEAAGRSRPNARRW